MREGRSGETGDQTNLIKHRESQSYSESAWGGEQGPRPIQPALRHMDNSPTTLLLP